MSTPIADVTTVVPVFNAEVTIREALALIDAQTISPRTIAWHASKPHTRAGEMPGNGQRSSA